jgi:hypothetical protein
MDPMSRCPHCHALSSAEANAGVRWRCAVCGGPVVPDDGSFARSGAELESLVAAARARGMALGWIAATMVLGATVFVCLPVAVLIAHAARAAGWVLASVAGLCLVLSVASALRWRRAGKEASLKLEEAWQLVAGEALRARDADMTAADLAKCLRTDEVHAERLLSQLSALGRARVAVSDEAQLSYRLAAGDAGPQADDATPGAQARRSS